MKLIAIVVVSLFHTASFKGLVGTERDVPTLVSDELSLDDLEAGEEIDLEHEIPKDVEPIGPAVEGDKYQGDEILTAEQKAELGIADRDGMESELEMRQAITRATRKWPKKDGKVYVPYELGTHFSANEKAVMSRGFEEYAKHTCIRMVPRTSQRDYVTVIKDGGCYSYVGRIGGPQKLSLDRGCLYDVGTSMHEFMHAIGYQHEQSRSDRDNYVRIIWKNIPNNVRNNFEKANDADLQGLPYDTGSVMHYSSTAFGGGRTTIESIHGAKLGQRNGFSKSDIVGINKLYCDGDTTNPTTTKPTKPECEDKSEGCPGWADAGFCESGKYIKYMADTCKKSCGLCGAGGKCTDTPPEWAMSVSWTCQTYVEYGLNMASYCQKDEWKNGKLCGKVCKEAGYPTDLNCK